jgi:MFS transporter, DHA2 family, multidrug resistance protein
MGNATSIFNLMRNIGGSFGIAIMTTFLTRRAQFHQNHLIENVQPGSLRLQEMLAGMQAWFHSAGADKYTASRKALAAMYGLVQRHAAMLSFVEAFWIMGVVFLLIIPLIFLLRNPIKEHATERAMAAGTAPQVQEEEEILLVH